MDIRWAQGRDGLYDRWARGRYDSAAAVSALRTAPVTVHPDPESPEEECSATVQVGELDLELWFPFVPDASGAPSLDAISTAVAQVTMFDDIVQAENEAQARRGLHGPENYSFDLAIMTLTTEGVVTLDYWGTEVNTQYLEQFTHRNGTWHRDAT